LLKLSILDTIYVYVSFLIKFDDKLNERDAINLKRSSIICVCGCICMCNSLSPIVRRHHHLDLYFYGLVIVASERIKAQHTIQLNTTSASRSVYICIYIYSKSNRKRKQNKHRIWPSSLWTILIMIFELDEQEGCSKKTERLKQGWGPPSDF
jgi:hypothetical protein